MNEPAKKWVAELKSGKYKQGGGYLHKGDRFCCLGVACELAAREGLIPAGVLEEEEIYHYGYDVCLLPDEVRKWLGLRTKCGTTSDGKASLVAENDSGKTFLEIANIIESEPAGLFA